MAITFTGTNDEDFENGETLIGADSADAGGIGSLTVDGASILDLTSSNLAADPFQALSVGTAADGNGDGSVLIDAGSTIRFTCAVDGAATAIRIGRYGSQGLVVIDGASTLSVVDSSTVGQLESGDDAEALVVGRESGSSGELRVEDGSTFAMEGNGVNVQIGRNAGTGLVTLSSGSVLTLVANGNSADSLMSMRLGNQNGATGRLDLTASTGSMTATALGMADITVGLNTGYGTFNLSSSTFTLTGGALGAHAAVGVGGFGTMSAVSSTFTINGATGDGEFLVGSTPDLDGGEGDVDLRDSIVNIAGAASAHLEIGNGLDSIGYVDLAASSEINLDVTGATGNAVAVIGRDSATARLSLRDSSLTIAAPTLAELTIGQSDAYGTFTARNGTVTLSGDSAHVEIGSMNGVGSALLDASTLDINATTNVDIDIGSVAGGQHANGGQGRLTLQNGSAITIDGAADSNVIVGGGLGSTASLILRGGSSLDFAEGADTTGFAALRIAAHWTTGASVIVQGSASSISDVDRVTIGYLPSEPGYVSGGSGALFLRDGGTLSLASGGLVLVGQGGLLGGNTGTVNGNVQLAGNGVFDLRSGNYGTFTINGTLKNTGGNSLLLEMSAGNADRLDVDVLDIDTGELVIWIAPLSSYKFTAGQIRTVVTFGDLTGDLPSWLVSGQHADFSFYGGTRVDRADQLVIQALNSGATGGVGTLDFGTGTGATTFTLNAATKVATVKGGVFGADGGFAYKVDSVLGTNGADNFNVTGTAAVNLIFQGRGGNDTIKSGAGADTLYGGLGNDTLTGGAGKDTFVFNTTLNGTTNVDRILDFNVADDRISLDNAVMTALAAGPLAAITFWKSTAGVAHDANDRIIYDTDSGNLFYDANGNAAGGATLIARLSPNLALTAGDFLVI